MSWILSPVQSRADLSRTCEGSGTETNNGDSLEERRKAKGAAYYERKKVAARQLSDAKKNASVKAETTKALASFGY